MNRWFATKEDGSRPPRPLITVVLLALALTVGGLAVSPVGAHVNKKAKHVWNGHIKEKVNKKIKKKTERRHFRKGEIRERLVKVAAARDTDAAEVTDQTNSTTISEVSIAVPKSGCLVIQGSAVVDNNHTSEETMILEPLLGGALLEGASARGVLDGELAPAASPSTLAYSTAVNVGGGTHTVTQRLKPVDAEAENYAYNSEALVVEWHPGGRCSVNA